MSNQKNLFQKLICHFFQYQQLIQNIIRARKPAISTWLFSLKNIKKLPNIITCPHNLKTFVPSFTFSIQQWIMNYISRVSLYLANILHWASRVPEGQFQYTGVGQRDVYGRPGQLGMNAIERQPSKEAPRGR